jgi:hypothetical protein
MQTEIHRSHRSAPIESGKDPDGVSLLDATVKIGMKGPKLTQWAQSNAITLPARLYDVSQIVDGGLLVRVGNDEIVLECQPENLLLGKIERALADPFANIYTRIAGVSCGIIPFEESGQRLYRIWVDYTLAAYLWETLAEIAVETRNAASAAP